MSKKVTITDVAEKAGVSTGTVSAVINEKSSVRQETRERVLSTIDVLGYEPSRMAQNLGARRSPHRDKTGVIGMIVKEVKNPFYSEVIKGAHDYINENGYRIYIGTSEGGYKQEGGLITSFREMDLDGAIIAPVIHEDVDLSHLFTLRKSDFPFVLLERVQGLRANVVSIDNVEAGRKSAAHLLNHGHERILHFAGPPYTQHSRDRIRGVQIAFSESNHRFSDDIVIQAGAHMEEGYRAAKSTFKTMNSGDLPTGISCFNDLVALGVLRALAEAGITVPDDVSVVGCDDIPTAAYLSVPLTTVRAPKYEMGQKAAALLLDHVLSSTEGTDRQTPRHEHLESELIVRSSTSPISSVQTG